ncbi:hypothetical protein [Deinococcus puniceus]|uniref:Uncharacterized protein n=1 Tax=Deinococcus puniceus TaxID=1182568 RepID=A0A172TC62_9DEIO|nr:hypothetical protein [Deinococcus puniceus]ANE44393.1 hypothetical protein SU48_12185 [Deinococcus puniceus]
MADFLTGEQEAGVVQQVFLLEDAAGGGLLLSTDSMRRLPPWPEGVSDLLSSVCTALYALPALQSGELHVQAELYMAGVLAEAGRRLEGCTGRLDAGSQVVYLGKAGGFVCGPVPWTQPQPLSASLLAPPAPQLSDHTDDTREGALGWERAR